MDTKTKKLIVILGITNIVLLLIAVVLFSFQETDLVPREALLRILKYLTGDFGKLMKNAPND